MKQWLIDKMNSYDWKELMNEQYQLDEDECETKGGEAYEVDGIKFYTLSEAADYFNCSESRLKHMLEGYYTNTLKVKRL